MASWGGHLGETEMLLDRFRGRLEVLAEKSVAYVRYDLDRATARNGGDLRAPLGRRCGVERSDAKQDRHVERRDGGTQVGMLPRGRGQIARRSLGVGRMTGEK